MKMLIRRTIQSSLLLATLVLVACHTPQPSDQRMICGNADVETMTNLGLFELAADYYVAHHEWPLSKAQLEAQLQGALKEMKSGVTPEEAKELSKFLKRFDLLEIHAKGADLVLHYRFRVEGKTIEHTATLKPGRTAEEILEKSAEVKP